MPFSDNFLTEAFNGGKDPILTLLRIQFEGETFHFANNNENITSAVSGTPQSYLRSRFELALPDDTEEGTPKATLDFEAADIQIARALRQANSPLNVDIWLVLGSDPNSIEYGPSNYKSAAFSISGNSISIELEVEPVLQTKLPRQRFTPNTFPGLFEGAQ